MTCEIVTTKAKLSFDDVAIADDNLLHNSNMLNLVSASKNIDGDIEMMEAEIARLRAVQFEIKVFATDDKNLQNTSEVDRLHGLTMSPEKRRKRW